MARTTERTYTSRIYKSWKTAQEQKYEAILEVIPEGEISGRRIADIGSGSGFFEAFLKSRDYNISKFVSVEPDEFMASKDKTSRKKVQARAESLPLESRSFDGVICIDAIHLITDAKDMIRILKPKGWMLVALFCNPENMAARRREIRKKLQKLRLVKQRLSEGKELEIIMLFRKVQG
jgi:ubiquinone/menaquinone biosynthesis C-methylase UbiE